MGGVHHAQSVYDVALLEYNNSIHEVLSTAIHPHKWWSRPKTFLFGVNFSLPPIRTENDSVTYDPSKMAEDFLHLSRMIRNSIFLQLFFPILNPLILL